MIFHNEINVRPLPNGKHWITKDWVAVSIQKYGLIFIPKYFETDFGTIPRILWTIVGAPATGKHRRAVLFHDWIYSSQNVDISIADRICMEIMIYDEVNFFKRYVIFIGIKIGGWKAWSNKTVESIVNYKKIQGEQFEKLDRFINFNIYA